MLQDITLENLHHAYLIIGDTKSTRGELSKWFLTHGVETSGNPDFFEVETSTFLIDQAREIKRFLSQKGLNKKHIFVIIRTEYFSVPAQNALLKVVEEPGEDVTIFILTPKKHIILPTILSRVVEMKLQETDENSKVSELVASDFINAKIPSRLQMVETFLKHHKDDSDSSLIKFEIDNLTMEIEKIFSDSVKDNKEKLKHVWFVRKYLGDQGSSPKILLEYLATMV